MPQSASSDATKATNTPYHDWTIKQVSASQLSSSYYPRLFSAKRLPSPALETPSHASAYTDQDRIPFCKPPCMQAIELPTRPWRMSQHDFSRGISPMRIYYHLPRAVVVCLSTNKSSLPINDTCPSHMRSSILTPPERGLHVQVDGCAERNNKISRGVCQGVRKLRARVHFRCAG